MEELQKKLEQRYQNTKPRKVSPVVSAAAAAVLQALTFDL